MVRAVLVCAAVVVCMASSIARAQQPAVSDGWVVIPVDEYRSLRLKAFPPERPPAPPPLDAATDARRVRPARQRRLRVG